LGLVLRSPRLGADDDARRPYVREDLLPPAPLQVDDGRFGVGEGDRSRLLVLLGGPLVGDHLEAGLGDRRLWVVEGGLDPDLVVAADPSGADVALLGVLAPPVLDDRPAEDRAGGLD